MSDLKTCLRNGVDTLAIDLNDDQLNRLLLYLELIVKWSKTYNLTAVLEPEAIICRHLLDSLVIASFPQGDCWIDIGTGAGLPGIPLAITFPDKAITLLDSNGKKTRFLFHVCMELGLNNVRVEHSRAERFKPERRFDVVFSRAVTSLAKVIDYSQHLLHQGGRFWLMKGTYPKQELSELPKDYKVLSVNKLDVPGLEEERHLIELGHVAGCFG